MQTRHNEATLNRPEGDRPLDLSVITMNFDKNILQLRREKSWKKNDRNGITLYKTDGVTIVLTCLHKDAAIENNISNSLLTIQVLDGAIDFAGGRTSQTLKKNEAVAVHPGIQHTIRAKEDAAILLISTTIIRTLEH